MELELTDMEAAVGDFSLDLLAKDLGSGHSASTVLWLVEVVRDEHRQALERLNQRTDQDTQFVGIAIRNMDIPVNYLYDFHINMVPVFRGFE